MYREFLASGKTIKAWCEENGIARTTFHNRLKQMREAALETKHEIVPVNAEICQRNTQWIELEKAPKAPNFVTISHENH